MNSLDILTIADKGLSKEEALVIAKEYSLEEEVRTYIEDYGYSPEAALEEWDIGGILSFNVNLLNYDN